jgi:hypothetical protein
MGQNLHFTMVIIGFQVYIDIQSLDIYHYIYIHTIIDPQKIGRQSPQKIPSRVHRAAWHKAWVDRSYGKPIIDAQRGSGLLISLVLWHFAAGNYCIY